MSDRLAHFVDFSKGHAGNIDKRLIGEGYWQGWNVQSFRDGSVGPYAAPIESADDTDLPAGTAYQMGYIDRYDTTDEYVWVHKGTKVARVLVYDEGVVQQGESWVEATGSFAATPDDGICDYVDYDVVTAYITLLGDETYKLDHSTNTLTAVSGSSGGRTIETYRDYLVIGGTDTNPNRIRFTSRGDPEDWPSANFLDLVKPGTPGPRIVALRTLRDALLAWTNMGQLFVITGKLDANPTVRQFMPGDQTSGPAYARGVARSREGSVWWMRKEANADPYWRPSNAGTNPRPSLTPVVYTGGQRVERQDWSGFLTDNYDSNPRRATYQAFSGRAERSVGFLSRSFGAQLLRDGQGSAHVLPILGTDPISCSGQRGEVYLMASVLDEGDEVSRLWAWWWEQDRPPATADTSMTIAADVASVTSSIEAYLGWFATPMVRNKNDEWIRVSRVDVLFTSYAAQSAGDPDNTFEVAIQQFGALNAAEKNYGIGPVAAWQQDDNAGAMVDGGATIGCTAAFAEAPDEDYNIDRRVSFFPLANAVKPAPMVRVLCRKLRGVAIREIVVYGTTEAEPRG